MKTASILLFVIISMIAAIQTSSAQTVAVGNCRPHLVSYSTISEAVAAAAPNSTVLVCPGTYPEQVTISQPLTLKGLKGATGAYPVITVPSGGLTGDYSAQLVAFQPPFNSFGPVNISNLVVDGTGSGVDCSTGGGITGIEYVFANGSLNNVEVRNQTPGGCGFGIVLGGGEFTPNQVSIRNSNIHDFDNTGISAVSNGGSSFLLNLISNRIESTSPSVVAGVSYASVEGLIKSNIVAVGGQTGLQLDNIYCCVTATENTVVGSNVGIYLGGSPLAIKNIVSSNLLSNNGTGIFVYGPSALSPLLESNEIIQSSNAAIDLDCSSRSTAEHNTIADALVGIANMAAGDAVSQNSFLSVVIPTSACP